MNNLTIAQIWDILNSGKKVYWSNNRYQVLVVDYSQGINEYSALSLRDNKALRITCTENYFGSLISQSDLAKCYTIEPLFTLTPFFVNLTKT